MGSRCANYFETMSDKQKQKVKGSVRRISFLLGQRIEFYTPFTLEECSIHLSSAWSGEYKYFTVPPWQPMIKIDYVTPETTDSVKFKVSAKFGEGTRGETTSLIGHIQRIDNTSTLVTGKITSSIRIVIAMAIVFLVMGYCFLGSFILNPDIGGYLLVCWFLAMFLISSWATLSHQSSLQSVLIEAVHKVLSSDTELPLSVRA
jgi:hypothetical protein